MYFETSAKTGQNVNKMFYMAIAHLSFFDVYNLPFAKIAEELGKNALIKKLRIRTHPKILVIL
jgi:hypothetical protein